MQDLSSPRDRTHVPCADRGHGSEESQPLDHHGSPYCCLNSTSTLPNQAFISKDGYFNQQRNILKSLSIFPL